MKTVGKFEKISIEQWEKDFPSYADASQAERIHHAILMPARATKGSAGYDFFSPFSFTLKPGETILVPTGIRASMREDWMLAMFPRSGLGFKFRLQLNNTVGIIDSDYYGADNEGHIMCKITNDSREDKELVIETGQAFVQGVFLPYGIVEGDKATERRVGGFGSTR